MKQALALAACSTMAQEFHACNRQLGLQAKLYGTRPICLYRVPEERLDDLLTKAGSRHEHVVLALGACCGDMSALAARHRATLLKGLNCRHLYLGPAAYEWCGQHHVLPLSCHCFRMTLRQARDPFGELLEGLIESGDVQRIAAIDNGLRHPEPSGIEQIARMTGRETFVWHTGLGHLREALRGAAREEGVEPDSERALIRPESLGPGDDLLLVSGNGAPCLDIAAQLLGNCLDRGLKCVWVVGRTTEHVLADRLRATVLGLDARREMGALELLSSDELLGQGGPDRGPQGLARLWKTVALEALNQGYAGLAVIHGFGWSERAGLLTDYLLDYASRVSAVCADWPLLSASECPPEYYSASAFDELTCTHPLIWAAEGVMTSARYEPSDEYLGSEGLREALETERRTFECSGVAPLVSALIDGELHGKPAAAVAAHVAQCPKCGELMVGSRDLKAMLRGLRGSVSPLPHDLWERLSNELA